METNRFTAYGEDGYQVTILEITAIAEDGPDTGASDTRGTKRLQTLSGMAVLRKAKGVYLIPELGNLEVRSGEPNAT